MKTSAPGRSIMVVDDNRDIAEALESLLVEQGFTVIVVTNGDEALSSLRRPHDIRTLVTDFTMPGSIDGLQLAIAAHALSPTMSIILISGTEPAPEDLPAYIHFLAKPFSTKQVSALVALM
jgi:DNA-binding NtrC family response regulator